MISHTGCMGQVVKRGLVDPALCASLVDTCWENAPEPLVRDDPRTWLNVGEAWAKLPPAVTADGKRSYRRLSNPSANSEWRYHALGFQQEFLAATSGKLILAPPCVDWQSFPFEVTFSGVP